MPLKNTIHEIWTTTQEGYNRTNWIIFVIAGSAVLTKLFGFSATVATVIALLFFYTIGRLYSHMSKPDNHTDEKKTIKA